MSESAQAAPQSDGARVPPSTSVLPMLWFVPAVAAGGILSWLFTLMVPLLAFLVIHGKTANLYDDYTPTGALILRAVVFTIDAGLIVAGCSGVAWLLRRFGVPHPRRGALLGLLPPVAPAIVAPALSEPSTPGVRAFSETLIQPLTPVAAVSGAVLIAVVALYMRLGLRLWPLVAGVAGMAVLVSIVVPLAGPLVEERWFPDDGSGGHGVVEGRGEAVRG
ncbi:hypothetical protein FHX37_3425 [Haloactinospora alba]|uniref:Uncharacterized protein n=1 Tax=Haloactinospora alba TaxID=405555 RepID=A0A543NNJ6_9ACTN|nr:hypothetical protein [Haloactinospora alba]TQN33409.1 hypothetical protein FHX37_3425 [Haloactinospora alba]